VVFSLQLNYRLSIGFLVLQLVWATASVQIELNKTQYENQIDDISTAIKGVDKNYKEIEGGFSSFFPESSRKSPFYTSINIDFRTYSESMKNLEEYRVSLNNFHKLYSKFFSVGLLKTTDVLQEGDKNWEKALELSTRMNETIFSAQNELNRMEQLYPVLSSFLEQLDSVLEFRKELESDLKQTSKEFDDISDKTQNLIRKFQAIDTSLVKFPVYVKEDSIRQLLAENIQIIGAVRDSIHTIHSFLDYLLEGESKSDENSQVWELYGLLAEKKKNFSDKIQVAFINAEVLRVHLRNGIELTQKFSELLGELDEGISSLIEHQEKNDKELEFFRIQSTSLIEEAPSGLSTEDMPYRDLENTFQRCENSVLASRSFITNALGIKERLITDTGKMLILGEQESKIFRQLEQDYNNIEKEALHQYEQYAEIAETFRNIIRLDFINTPQYWELEYAVEEQSSRDKGLVIEENFGYLHDPNEYPDKLQHGKLITTFQLRMRKWQPRGKSTWDYRLIFEGSNDFSIEGIVLTDGDSILYQISRENIDNKVETREDGRLKFVWELPVEKLLLNKIIQANKPILKIHFFTITNRINATLYRQKVFKEYQIPKKRLAEWDRWITYNPAI